MSTSKVLVTGANGLLGVAVVSAFRNLMNIEVVGMGHHELDVTDAEHVSSLCDTMSPELVVNCAGYTMVDDCETNEALAVKVNGQGAGNVAKAALAARAGLIQVSTDYVFDGAGDVPLTEDHLPAEPSRLSAYGRSKLLGEQSVLAHHPGAVIVRSAWLFGEDGHCFPKAILAQARTGKSLRVVTDQVGSPTYTVDLAEAIVALARAKTSGLFHIANAGRCSWHEFATEILRLADMDVRVEGVTSVQIPRAATRPAFSVLSSRKYQDLTGSSMRSWQEALRDYLS